MRVGNTKYRMVPGNGAQIKKHLLTLFVIHRKVDFLYVNGSKVVPRDVPSLEITNVISDDGIFLLEKYERITTNYSY